MSNSYRAVTDLIDSSLFTKDDGSIDYQKLWSLFPVVKDLPHGVAQSQRVPNTFNPNESSSIYRSSHSPNHLIDRLSPDITTMNDLFDKAVELYTDSDCLGTRYSRNGVLDADYTFDSYKEVQLKRNYIGSGIRKLVDRDDAYIVSLFSSNRAEWLISSLAIQAFGLISTSLYDTLGPTTSKYILEITESPILITDYSKIPAILDLKKQGLPNLKYIVSMDQLEFHRDNGLISLASQFGIKLIDFKQLETIGKLNQIPTQEPNETMCISFTSGTTGNPKGVVITQKMAVASMAFAGSFAIGQAKKTKGETQVRYLSFLPLAHIYELQSIYDSFSSNYKIYFPWDPSPLKLLDHLKFIKPHTIALVPRVFNRMESALRAGLSKSFLGRQVFTKIIEYKQDKNQKGENSDVKFFDKLIVPKIRSQLGFDSANFVINGSAPLANDTFQFLKAALNLRLMEGYGLTESFGGISASQITDLTLSAGPIGIAAEIKLRDVKEMGYTSTNPTNNLEKDEPEGEILLRGPQIFERYYKDEKATTEAIDEDGWFHTGDIARIDKLGRTYIIDRVKNFFKLAQGEYVSPQKIETVYTRLCPEILTQAFIHGDSLQTYLVGILGVDPIGIRELLKPKYIELLKLDDHDLLTKVNENPQIKTYLLNHLNDLIKKEGLHGFEKLHNFKVKIDPLKIEDGVVTPTLKLKRGNARQFFRNELDELYREGSLLRNAKL